MAKRRYHFQCARAAVFSVFLTLTLATCSDIKNTSRARTRDGGAITGSAGFSADAAQQDVATPITATPATACAKESARACVMHGGRDVLICEGGSWQPGPPCAQDERCDSTRVSARGPCRQRSEECADLKEAGTFCDADA
jgi:hypothetical protein